MKRVLYDPEYKERPRYTVSIHYLDNAKEVLPQIIAHYVKDGYLILHSSNKGEAHELKDIWEWKAIYPTNKT